jgi:hypothetical protein
MASEVSKKKVGRAVRKSKVSLGRTKLVSKHPSLDRKDKDAEVFLKKHGIPDEFRKS